MLSESADGLNPHATWPAECMGKLLISFAFFSSTNYNSVLWFQSLLLSLPCLWLHIRLTSHCSFTTIYQAGLLRRLSEAVPWNILNRWYVYANQRIHKPMSSVESSTLLSWDSINKLNQRKALFVKGPSRKSAAE